MTWTWPNSTVTAVVDGDTFDARVTRDIGFGGTTTFLVRLRLNRINAPKLSSEAGKSARARLRALVTPAQYAQIETLKPYKYGGPDSSPGEWMAEVVVNGMNVSDLMVSSGHAVYWDGEGPRPQDAG